MGTKMGKMLSLVVVLLLMLALSGCTRTAGMSEEELVEEVLRVHYTMETVSYTEEMSIVSVMDLEGEAITTTMETTLRGMVDYVNERMRTETIMSFPAEDGAIEQMTMTMYFMDGMMYMQTTFPGAPGGWSKMEIPEGFEPGKGTTLLPSVPIEQMIKLLQASEIEILGVEEVDGISCYVIKITPDMRVLFQITMEQLAGEEMPSEEEMELACIADMFEGVTIKYWIARDSFLPIKEMTEMSLAMDGRMDGMAMEMNTTKRYYNHNEPVVIELPPEAAAAESFAALVDFSMPPFEEYMSGAIIPAEVSEADMERLEELYNKTIAEPENKEAWNQFWDLKEELKIEW